MRNTLRNIGGQTTMFFALFVGLMVLNAVVGGWLWPYTINTWLEFAGKAPSVVWWQGALIGFVPYLGHATIPAAIITWILMLFLV